jgi:hypothetical protein
MRWVRRLLGVGLVIASVLFVPIWLFAAAWVGATADVYRWAVFCGLLGVGILLFLAGAGLIIGRFPTGRAGLVWSIAVVVPLALFLVVFFGDRGAARVNAAVSRDYADRRDVSRSGMYTTCDYALVSPGGTEWWMCDVEPYHENLDVCHVEVTRHRAWRFSVRITTCRGDVHARDPAPVDAGVEVAYARHRRVKGVHATCTYAGAGSGRTESWLCRVSALPVKEDGRVSMLDRYRDLCSVDVGSADGSSVVTHITSCRADAS